MADTATDPGADAGTDPGADREPDAYERRARDAYENKVESNIHVAGHPIHVMLVTFPIALVCATLGSDLFFWWTGDPFFARTGLWTSGWGFALGVASAISGTIELLSVRGIRRTAASWSHAVAAMMLLSVIGANWGLRLYDHEAAVLPWGLFLSLLGMVFVGLAGWHGGKLVFEHHVGIKDSSAD